MAALTPNPTTEYMQFNRFSLLLLLLPLGITLRGQPAETVSIGTAYKLFSQALGEERQYVVNLPASYEKDIFYNQKKYPVLILLDADTHFQTACGIIRSMSAGETEHIPELIIVAVRNTNRTRDMAPSSPVPETEGVKAKTSAANSGGANFLRFLETELLPQIERQYRTLPYRLLVGHSLAGLFTVNSFLDQRLFNAYITIDPTLGYADGFILKKAKSVLALNTSFTATLYIAQANNPFEPGKGVGTRGKSFDSFVASLTTNRSKRLQHKYDFFENEDHYSVPLLGLYHGLQFVFDGYKFPVKNISNQTGAGINEHYKRFFNGLGVDLLPPGKVINQVGLFMLHNQKQFDKAIDLLTLNEMYYPNSVVTYNSLGEAYKLKGDKQTAIRYFEKALALDPANENAGKAVKELKGQ